MDRSATISEIYIFTEPAWGNINLSGYALPADTYSGLLRLRARATP